VPDSYADEKPRRLPWPMIRRSGCPARVGRQPRQGAATGAATARGSASSMVGRSTIRRRSAATSSRAMGANGGRRALAEFVEVKAIQL
jgi:hypothetical protein